MSTLHAFTWGYEGWGSAMQHFVRAADALERSRGFQPPVFIDLRLLRNARAPAFRGKAMEEIVGEPRYVWMRDLGNLAISHESNKLIEIKAPADAVELYYRLEALSDKKRRAILFCHCPAPLTSTGRRFCCHRAEVARLLSLTARLRGRTMHIAEWPGTDRTTVHMDKLSDSQRHALKRSAKFIPIGNPAAARLPKHLWLGWGSTVRFLRANGQKSFSILTGPAIVRYGQWGVRNLAQFDGEEETPEFRPAALVRTSPGLIV